MHHLDRDSEGTGHKEPTVINHLMVELLIPVSCETRN